MDAEIERLKQWFLKMGVKETEEGGNLLDECAMLMSPQLKDTWKYIIDHVRPVHEIQHVKKVLLLDHLRQKEDKAGTRIKLTARVSSIEEFKQLEEFKKLKSKVKHNEEEINFKIKKIDILLKNRKELMDTRRRLEDTNTSNGVMYTIVDNSCKTMQNQLHKTVELLELADDAYTTLLKSVSSTSEAYTSMVIKECSEKINSYVKKQLSKGINSDMSNEQQQLMDYIKSKCSGIPMKTMYTVVDKRIYDITDTISKLHNRHSVEEINDSILSLENLPEKITELKEEQIRLHLDNTGESRKLKETIDALKQEKEILFSLVSKKNESNSPNLQAILRKEFDIWFASEMDVIDLKEKARFLAEYSNYTTYEPVDVTSLMEQYKIDMGLRIKRTDDVRCKLVACIHVLSNANAVTNMSEALQSNMSLFNFEKTDMNPNNRSLQDMVLSEFQKLFEIPYKAFIGGGKLNSTDNISSELASIPFIYYQLWLLKRLNIPKLLADLQPSFTHSDIKSRINEVVKSEEDFLSTANNLLVEIEQNGGTVQNVSEACKNSLEICDMDEGKLFNYYRIRKTKFLELHIMTEDDIKSNTHLR